MGRSPTKGRELISMRGEAAGRGTVHDLELEDMHKEATQKGGKTGASRALDYPAPSSSHINREVTQTPSKRGRGHGPPPDAIGLRER